MWCHAEQCRAQPAGGESPFGRATCLSSVKVRHHRFDIIQYVLSLSVTPHPPGYLRYRLVGQFIVGQLGLVLGF